MSLLRRQKASNNTSKDVNKPFTLPRKPTANEGRNSSNYEDMIQRNRKAMQSGDSLVIKRLPFLSFLSPSTESLEAMKKKLQTPFKSPCSSGMRTVESNRLLQVKTLGCRRRWSNIMSTNNVTLPLPNLLVMEPEDLSPVEDTPIEDIQPSAPSSIDENAPPPLLLWQSPEDPDAQVIVPEIVGKFLRPHQREGVQFMFDCVSRVRGFDGDGCILADDMGLGKTLQSITLMYTLLMTSMQAKDTPTIKRCIVVCPTSLVKNWDDEIIKWLHGRVKTIALFEANREDVIRGIGQFIEGSKRPRPNVSAQVLIISYETFRIHAKKFHDEPCACELLICDEAHRLKNSQSQISRALSGLHCRRRVLLSGTPMQNDLEEFFSMVDFTNPNILGTPAEFRKKYLSPILVGREPDATDKERNVAQLCSAKLCDIVNQFILRRGNILNAKHLPPKLMQVICCPLSQLQQSLYTHFLNSSAFRDMMRRNSSNVLSSITALKKLCNHPLLIFDENGKTNTNLPGFSDCAHLFHMHNAQMQNSHNSTSRRPSSTCHPEWSGKFLLLDRLMQVMRKRTTDRIVIVSNYTQTLDVVTSLCKQRQLPYVRLDGSTSAKKRKMLVDTFNNPTSNSFAFLLSSKAGGCGLNLIGANRLVLFDPDWNPATDKQAAARVWREGQKKMSYIYRFLATGTLEEKIFQRQLSKEGLQNIVDDKEEVNSLSSKDLKRLFVLRTNTMSDTHDQLKCERCKWHNKELRVLTAEDEQDSQQEEMVGREVTITKTDDTTNSLELAEKNYHPQLGMPPEEDLNNWGHHRLYDSVDDEVMQEAIQTANKSIDLVSFAFTCRVDWQLLQENQAANEEKENLREEIRKRKRLELKKLENEAEKKVTPNKPNSKRRKKIDSGSESSNTEDSEEEIVFDSDDEFNEVYAYDVVENDTTKHEDNVPHRMENQSAPNIVQSEVEVKNAQCANSNSQSSDSKHSSNSRIAEYAIDCTMDSDEENDDEELDAMCEELQSAPPVARPRIDVGSSNVFGVSDNQSEQDILEFSRNNSIGISSNIWECSRCTLHNSMSDDICSTCGWRNRRTRLHQEQQDKMAIEEQYP